MLNFNNTNKTIIVFFMFIFGMLFSLTVLNRWLVTDLGLLSYGRVWQLYVSYTDFGFIRRGFLGTLLSESGINKLFYNEYIFAIIIHHISIFILTILVAYYCLINNIKDFFFIIGIAFSPTFIIYQGYNTGTLDIFVLLIALINILYVKNYIIFSINIIAGIFLHELFIFTLPAQFFSFYLCDKSKNIRFTNLSTLIPVITTLLAILMILFFGKTNISEIEFKNIMQIKISSAYMMHSLWSGYYEINSSLERNITTSMKILFSNFENGKIIFLLPILLYLTVLMLRTVRYMPSYLDKILLTIVIIFPMITSLVAWDYPRWIAMSANMSILITLKLAAKNNRSYSKWNKLIVIFCLFAPFGTAGIDHPLPLHQFVFDKLMN